MYLLFVPIIGYINTNTHQYYIQLKGLVKANFEGHKEELLQVKMKLLFFHFYFYPFKKKLNSHKKETVKKETSVKRKQKLKLKAGMKLLKVFKIKQFYVDVDTGNFTNNAKLYPLFAFLNYKVGGFHINFEGRNHLVLKIQTRPIHLINSFINL